MNPVLEAQLADSPQHADYERLPVTIKAAYTLKEYLWLSDREKAGLVQTETEPEA